MRLFLAAFGIQVKPFSKVDDPGIVNYIFAFGHDPRTKRRWARISSRGGWPAVRENRDY
jgi:hypothetical protein